MGGWMDGLFPEFCNGLCWVHSTGAEPARNPSPLRVFRQIQSPQDPLPSAAVTAFTRADQGWPGFALDAFHKALPACAGIIAPPPNPKGVSGQIPVTTKPVPTVSDSTEVPWVRFEGLLRL
jgi:hypothetical protein